MKTVFLLLCYLGISSLTVWQTDFEKAKQSARDKHELILLNFSGSDWCGPCMRMRKEIFESEVFMAMADSNLVLLNADFPRNRKNQLPGELKKQNELLADRYNPEGKFPFTLLISSEGRIIKAWDGLPEQTAQGFTSTVKGICNANK